MDFANWSTAGRMMADEDGSGSGHGSGDWDGSGSGDWDSVALDSPVIGMEPVATTIATTTTVAPVTVLGVEMCIDFSNIPGLWLGLFAKRGEFRKQMKNNVCGSLEEAGAFCQVDSLDNCDAPAAPIFLSDGQISVNAGDSYCFDICVDIEMAEPQVD